MLAINKIMISNIRCEYNGGPINIEYDRNIRDLNLSEKCSSTG